MTTPAVIKAPQVFAKTAVKASVMKEMVIGATLGLIAGLAWKTNHWNQRRKTEEYYSVQASKK
eukprot:CAMPEP_0198465500 /NCGR_PEP_ID=MMETSP1456-20131121/3394_1 /TAXON_ID=1461544 ORGANISM="Unidentified sp., Strain RCC1871" /NCGR_SAMPLE_ID=MMETSP1456 /ASSEMBLY_ACC=CAM_ASM_001119 /LENGTH=62 /DNA_ID=CAMNT_0044191361 /DNA_START=77 /DNA_END=265 /DNA_ORIENTATION=+